MSLKDKVARVAKEVVGMQHDDATKYIFKHDLSYKFIVMEGKSCERTSDHSNSTVCLFSDENDVIYYAHPGTKGAYAALAAHRPTERSDDK
jgi:hypothetical protein